MDVFSYSETTFKNEDYSSHTVRGIEYEECVFTSCVFAEADLTDAVFVDCTFNGCDLSLAKLAGTSIRDCTFSGCRMRGLHFDECNQFGLSLRIDGCTLDHSTMYGVKLPKVRFSDTRMLEVDFSDSVLTEAVFDECDLSGAVFRNTGLEGADFRTARNYAIDPEINRIKKAKFSMYGLVGLLDKYDIVVTP